MSSVPLGVWVKGGLVYSITGLLRGVKKWKRKKRRASEPRRIQSEQPSSDCSASYQSICIPAWCIALPAAVSLLGPRRACKKADSLQSIPCSPMQRAALSHPRYYPHLPAPALNIPHNKAKGSDKSYYFQPSHLEARGEADLPQMFLGEGKPVPQRKRSALSPDLIQQDRDGRRLAFSFAWVSTT